MLIFYPLTAPRSLSLFSTLLKATTIMGRTSAAHNLGPFKEMRSTLSTFASLAIIAMLSTPVLSVPVPVPVYGQCGPDLEWFNGLRGWIHLYLSDSILLTMLASRRFFNHSNRWWCIDLSRRTRSDVHVLYRSTPSSDNVTRYTLSSFYNMFITRKIGQIRKLRLHQSHWALFRHFGRYLGLVTRYNLQISSVHTVALRVT
ncbi:hypothetical protein GALMADRAFT_473372 [Galerina marginata CBS 339.88]|uniref:Uncharacterized protein n=1 Tax=Galerina marginata (strain CBS 339.88) TaxID=685588 RepID=A0A067T1T3_GALM3|nr:hypothetical protein GALMADRAFT_473372 [Galerina marginata CBS 339.88]